MNRGMPVQCGAALRRGSIAEIPARRPAPRRARQDDANAAELEGLRVERYLLRRNATATFRGTATDALLILPLQDGVDVETAAIDLHCPAGTALLHAQPLSVTIRGGDDVDLLVVRLRRDRLSIAASKVAGGARRLAGVTRLLPDAELVPIAERIAAHAPRHDGLADSFHGALAGRIVALADGEACLPPVRAVSEAIRIVQADHAAPFSVERLASMVGVTQQTLRKGFRTTLGITAQEYVQSVRLDWAHARLDSAREFRSIHEIALLAGFPNARSFSRNYALRFGEAPGQTRAKAVHAVS